MTWRECMMHAAKLLKEAEIEDYDNDVRVLAMYVLNCNYTGLTMRMPEEATPEDQEFFFQCVEARRTHLPCQYITGSQEFMGYTFRTEREVLIPRPETELLVEEALRISREVIGGGKMKVLDLCCGTGCIGISYALCRRAEGFRQDEVTMVDISRHAVALSKENNKNLQAGCNVVKSDLFERLVDRYDMIISNPPYIRSADCEELMSDVRDYEPWLALDGREDGLYYYDRIIKGARRFLYENGMLLFEIGYDQLEDVRGLLVDAGYVDISGRKDYAGLDRIVIARWPGKESIM